MTSTPRKSTLKTNSAPLPAMNGDTPKKVRFSSGGRSSKMFSAADVLLMLNDNSLSELENSSSDEEWIVTKAKNSISVELTKQKSESISRKESDVVSPLKLLRKPEYEVNKVSSKNKKSESAVSPIVIKRKTETKKSSSVGVSADPPPQSSRCNGLDNKDGGDTENDITSIKLSTPSKARKSTKPFATPGSLTKKERKQYELECSLIEEFEKKIGKLKIADTPIKKAVISDPDCEMEETRTPKKKKSVKLGVKSSEDDVPLSKRLLETPGKEKSHVALHNVTNETESNSQSERRISKRIPTKKKIFDPDDEMDAIISPSKRSVRVSDVDSPKSLRKSRTPTVTVISDSDCEMEGTKTPKKKKSIRKSTILSDSDFEMECSKTAHEKKLVQQSDVKSSEDDVPLSKRLLETPGKEKSHLALHNVTNETESSSQSERRISKRIPTKKKVFEPDEEMEAIVSPPKRRSIRPSNVDSPKSLRKSRTQTLTVISDSDCEMEETKTPKKKKSVKKSTVMTDSDFEMEEEFKTPAKRKSARKSVKISRSYKEKSSDGDPSSPEVKRTPRRSVMAARLNKEKDNSDVEPPSPELKKTPRRSTMKCRESFVDSPDLRKQLLTPRFSAKKKLDMTSPASVKKVGSGFLSPVVSERVRRSLPSTPSSRIAEARASLHTANIPSSLPCREKEFDNVLGFLSRKIEDKAGGCMYISGVPGTGKTATVHAVVRTLQEQASTGELPKFDFIEINALRLTEPRQAYIRIWQELSGEKISADSAMKALEKKYTHKNKRPSVILVDELDYLCNRRQDVIYNILEWSTKSTAALAVISIANTMDLPERTLKGKVTSRMGLTRLVFQPYTFQQLQTIVLNRLGENLSFHVDAVQLVARKVAAVSGDARRALDICRRVTELVSSNTEVIKVTHVEKAISQIFSGTRVRAIKGCSIMMQFLLRAMRDEFQRTGVEESTVGQVYSQYTAICAFEGCEPVSVGVVLSLCTVLADSGLILAENSRADLNRKIALNVSADDIFYACNA